MSNAKVVPKSSNYSSQVNKYFLAAGSLRRRHAHFMDLFCSTQARTPPRDSNGPHRTTTETVFMNSLPLKVFFNYQKREREKKAQQINSHAYVFFNGWVLNNTFGLACHNKPKTCNFFCAMLLFCINRKKSLMSALFVYNLQASTVVLILLILFRRTHAKTEQGDKQFSDIVPVLT